MPIPQQVKLLGSSLDSVKDLYEKHQLNPDNNGVRPIDHVLSYSLEHRSLCKGDLYTIRPFGSDMLYRLRIKDFEDVVLTSTTMLLLADSGVWGSIADGQLFRGAKIGFYLDNELVFKSILDVTEAPVSCLHYSLGVPQRQNYVLCNGLVVKSD